MNTERLAEILHVDHVEVHHGPKGYALYVQLGDETLSTTIDKNDLNKGGKMHGVAHRLEQLADKLVSKSRANMVATAAALEADVLAARRFAQQPLYEVRGRQLQRSAAPEPPSLPPPALSQESAVSKSLPSRFHAIVAELNK